MKEKWLEDIKEKVAGFEMESPEGLWESIIEEMPTLENSKHRKSAVTPWRKITYAAASVAMLLGISCLFYLIEREDPVHNPALNKTQIFNQQQGSKAEGFKESFSQKIAGNQVKENQALNGNMMNLSSMESIPDVLKDTLLYPPSESTEELKPLNTIKNSADNKIIKEAEDLTQYDNSLAVAGSKSESTKFSLMASLSASGAGDSMTGNGFEPYRTGNNFYMDAGNSSSDETRMGGFYIDPDLFPQLKSQEVFDHKLPLRFGVDFSWQLNRSISLETGMTYTLLNSDIKYGRVIDQGKARQSLHYVGIPLAVRYSPLGVGNFEFYLKGGVLAEKCVAGKITTQTLSSEPYSYTGCSDRPFQFSVNAALGIQYDISKSCGVFVQPELGYYFNDGSSLRTIYKEHPLNFDLNIGFRFSFPK